MGQLRTCGANRDSSTVKSGVDEMFLSTGGTRGWARHKTHAGMTLYPSWLWNSVPIHPACPKWACLTVIIFFISLTTFRMFKNLGKTS